LEFSWHCPTPPCYLLGVLQHPQHVSNIPYHCLWFFNDVLGVLSTQHLPIYFSMLLDIFDMFSTSFHRCFKKIPTSWHFLDFAQHFHYFPCAT
jgi:hypothetical protein